MPQRFHRVLLLLFLCFIVHAPLGAWAANFYVRAGAAGAKSGADWTNAWSDFGQLNWSAINPGDTIYIAAGTYGALNVNESGAAGNPLKFVRATAAAHGTDTGWSSAYDARVIIDGGKGHHGIGIGNAVYAAQNFITVDGATRNGIWVRNAYYGVSAVYGSNFLTLRNLEIGDPGTYKMDEDGIQGKGDDLLVERCFVHDNDNPTTHGDGIQWFGGNRVTLRYNEWKNNGQQIYLGEGAWNTPVNDVNVYYNVIRNRGGGHYNGIVLFGNDQQAGRYYNFYNNTFDLEDLKGDGFNSIFYPIKGNATFNFKNNAMIASNASQVTNTNHTNNAYDNSGVGLVYNIPGTETGKVVAADLGFVDQAGGNYHLNASSPLIGKGTNVGLTQDFDGKAVPSTPSIGAFEYGSAAATPAPTATPIASATPRPTATATPGPTAAPGVSPTATPSGWQFCANEGGYCSFTGTRTVRYGAQGKYNTKTLTGGTACNNDVFGDPIYGVAKVCELAVTALSTPIPSPTPTATAAPAATQRLFTTQTPALMSNNDGKDYELGLRFTATVAGQITGVRFYKSPSESGAHTGKVYSAGGALLGLVTFAGETASGWQTARFATPITINANTEYVVTVNTGNKYYVATVNGLATQVSNGNLRSVVGGNGVFGPVGSKPTQSYNNTNYFRDVLFTPK